MTLSVDLYFSLRSPYSYLVLPRMAALEEDWDATVNLRVVSPIAVRQPDFFANAKPQWFGYFMRDCHRCAEFVGMPFRWARPDPVVMDPMTRAIPAEQPYIHRLVRLSQLAVERGTGMPFLLALSHLIWSGEVDGWNEGDHLASVAASVGLDLAEMDAVIVAEAERLDAITAAHEAAQMPHHYGVPLMVFDNEPFFGQDRFDQLLWRMQQKGLERRG